MTDLVEATGLVIWTAKLRIDHVAILQASASRVFKAAALTEAVMADSAVIASVEEEVVDLVEIASVAAVDLAVAASAGLVEEGPAVFVAAAEDET